MIFVVLPTKTQKYSLVKFLDRKTYICYKMTACSFFLPKGLFAFFKSIAFRTEFIFTE